MPEFSDYIVFVDESGDHSLSSIDPQFPLFTLAFRILEEATYIERVAPAFQRFKFEFWGHDGIVLHEHELRKSEGRSHSSALIAGCASASWPGSAP